MLAADLPRTDDDSPPSPVAILPATGDRTIPIFDLRWNRHEQSQWSKDAEDHLLLDLRLPQARVAADLACNSVTAFGACGVWDAQMQDRSNYECDWVPAKNDLRCELTTWAEQTKRQTKSWFELLSGNEIPFEVAPNSPKTLQDFAELTERDETWRGRQVEFPGMGKASHILRLAAAHDRVIHLFGEYGKDDASGPEFFYVILSKGARPVLGYLPSLSLFEDDAASASHSQELTIQRRVAEEQTPLLPVSELRIGGQLSFAVKPLLSAPLTHIYQIAAREDNNRAVYWLAIDDQQADGSPLFSMTKIASNVFRYTACASSRSEASAAVITIQKGGDFRALMDVEPSHTTRENNDSGGFEPPDTENGESPEAQCPYSLHLEWNHKQWAMDDPQTHCPAKFSPRELTIADDGTITAKPGTVDDSK